MEQNLNISFSLYNPKRKIRQTEDFRKSILEYGLYNNYPSLINALFCRSGVAQVCVDLFAIFLYGGGFRNPNLSSIKINNKGDTMDDLLKNVCKSVALFRGAALHFNFNLLSEITTISSLPFEWVRLGLPSDELYSDTIAYWDNWDNQSILNNRSEEDIEYFSRFNIDSVESEINEKGLGDYEGQVN
jgi:hypothetical protein